MIGKAIENWKKAQDAGAVLPCPRCGRLNMNEKLVRNALSRRADIYICSSCGTEEAMEDVPHSKSAEKEFIKLPLSHWFLAENVFGLVSADEIDDENLGVNISIDLKVSKEEIDEIVCGALEGGITYWCCKAEVIEDEYYGDYASEQISKGGSLRLYDNENGEEYVLTLEKLLKGIKLACEKGDAVEYLISENRLDMWEMDAIMCDVIVQYALFGEVIYG